MPELPEVESVCHRLRNTALGATIVRATVYRPQMTHPQAPAKLRRSVAGRRITAVERRGKHILLRLDGDITLRVHLRMTGNLTVIPDARLRPETTRIWFDLDDGRALILNDPRALGRITVHRSAELPDLLKGLGPEPFDPSFTPAYLAEAAGRTAKPVKIFLMDQKAVAGLGNIYAAEALFQARIHPAAPAREISARKLKALHSSIVGVLTTALHSAISAYGTAGRFTEGEFFPAAVYGREDQPCPVCRARIRRIPQGGRSTYFCPRCQR
ncbi:MAG: bifunctional DNA-formamidopyrimidine glycosylase/DNA-(apurinic or apyrimidinic site) lyase [Bryobacterales bacterium]|nr:bifunctional DNA-formamidopyrimidine glycosylase/DNA-(apurinic or apyrimidinic site) lyase [Bryobacterales bacterium]